MLKPIKYMIRNLTAKYVGVERVQAVSSFPEDFLLCFVSCYPQRMRLVYYVLCDNLLAIFDDNYVKVLWSWSF
jgi:hypothetical protein